MRLKKLAAFFPLRSVRSCNISSSAAHVLLSKADGHIGDMKNLPTAIAWECPWHTGDNWNEISHQTREASKFTQVETVYTDLCKKASDASSFVQSHCEAPRPILSSANSFKCWEILQSFHFLLSFTRLQEENWICSPSGCAELGHGDQGTKCISPLLHP